MVFYSTSNDFVTREQSNNIRNVSCDSPYIIWLSFKCSSQTVLFLLSIFPIIFYIVKLFCSFFLAFISFFFSIYLFVDVFFLPFLLLYERTSFSMPTVSSPTLVHFHYSSLFPLLYSFEIISFFIFLCHSCLYLLLILTPVSTMYRFLSLHVLCR